MEHFDAYVVILEQLFFESFERRLLLYRGVRDIAKAAASSSNKVTKEIAELANDAAVGFIDTDESCSGFSHTFLNRFLNWLLPNFQETAFQTQ